MDGGIGILQLNDYCLQRILSYVDIKGQISFAQTCTRFRDVFQAWSRCEYTYVSIIGDVEPRELILLSLVAVSVRKLNIFTDDLVSSFNDNYSGAKRHKGVSKFCKLIRSMDSLQSIKIWQVSPHPIVKHVLRALLDLPGLRELYLCTPKQIKLERFHRLELISIDMKISPRVLLRYCRSMGSLRTLHLSDRVSSSNLRDIVEQLPLLQELSFHIDRSNKSGLFACHLDTRYSLSKIFDFLGRQRALEVLRIKGQIRAANEAMSLANIKSLKSLDCSFAHPELVIYLTRLGSLRSLRITASPGRDISGTYLEVIRCCKDLSFLRIFDYNIGPDFVHRVAEVLEDIESKNTLELLIHGQHSSLSQEFKSNALDHKNLLLRSITATELLMLL